MKNSLLLIVILILIIALVFKATSLMIKESHEDGFYDNPGICEKCGNKLIKGVYGEAVPRVTWYCPDCP